MTKKNNDIVTFLDETYPHVGCELIYHKDYELAIAVMLSAQTTDLSVNQATEKLFKKYPDLSSLAIADIKDIEEFVHSLGLYQRKASNIIGIAKTLLEKFDGKLPSDKDELQTLPGIGNKSAGVIRAEIFKIPDLPVDTHILRITKRLGLANEKDDAYKTEIKFKKMFPQSSWIKLHHQLIHFGRDICTAKSPTCERCKLIEYCKK